VNVTVDNSNDKNQLKGVVAMPGGGPGFLAAGSHASPYGAGTNPSDFALLSYSLFGTLQNTVTSPIGSGDDFASAIAIGPVNGHGRIVAVGSSFNGTDYDLAIARYETAGLPHLDPSFGSGGTVVTPVGSNEDFANAVAFEPDGRMVV